LADVAEVVKDHRSKREDGEGGLQGPQIAEQSFSYVQESVQESMVVRSSGRPYCIGKDFDRLLRCQRRNACVLVEWVHAKNPDKPQVNIYSPQTLPPAAEANAESELNFRLTLVVRLDSATPWLAFPTR
jgi:hypothetical protein